MKIYAVGDSFTAGSELMDWKYYPDFPGYMTADEKNSNNSRDKINWYTNRTFLHRLVGGLNSPGYQRVLEEEKSQTYANQLAEILGIPVTNQGIGGCSQQTILRNLCVYLDNISEPHTVFLQPTGPTRFTQYQLTQQGKGFWGDFIAGHDHGFPTPGVKEYVDFKVLNETDYSWYMQWWINLKSCLSLIKSNPMIKNFYLVDSGIINYTSNYIQQNLSVFREDNLGTRILNLYDQLRQDDVILRFPFKTTEPVLCPGGHFNHTVHRRLAESLAEKIKPTL